MCRDIKVDSVTKLPQWETYEGILRLIFPPSSTSHLHKSTQTFISNQEYKAVTHSLLLEMTVPKLRCRYNNHINLAHQQFKTLNVIIFCNDTLPPPFSPKTKLYPGNFPLQLQHLQFLPPAHFFWRQAAPTIGVESGLVHVEPQAKPPHCQETKHCTLHQKSEMVKNKEKRVHLSETC